MGILRLVAVASLTGVFLLAGCQKKKTSDDDSAEGGTTSSGGSSSAGSGGTVAAGSGGTAAAGSGGLEAGGEAGVDGGGTGVCGDGTLDLGEECDGADLGNNTCTALGFGSGSLVCREACTFDVTGCSPSAACGNGVLDGPEQCDDGAANSDLEPDACRVNCMLPSCGDSALDSGETCDDGPDNSDFRPNRCRSDCRPAHCGDGLIDDGEDCDLDKLALRTCDSEGFSSGTLSCSETCELDTSRCFTCGDGVADGESPSDEGYEECDTKDLRGLGCDDFDFLGGSLGCSFRCEVDTERCGSQPPECGNDQVEDDEVCDGNDFAGKTCADYGFSGGKLTCSKDCDEIDADRCNTCGNGTLEAGEVCDDGNTEDDFTCAGDCRADCGVGFGECEGSTSTYCAWDPSGGALIRTEVCDPVQGLTCSDGLCRGVCAVSSLGSSYLGCDYYPTIVNNQLLSTSVGDFAVAVANTGGKTANITVTQGATAITTATAAPGDVAVIVLPWTSMVTARTVLAVDGAYRLRTDQPVTVYQYNPLNYIKGTTATYTNDASLLLPTNTWTGNYVVAARNFWSAYPGLYAVVAREDDTEVTLTPSATGGIVAAGAGVLADGTGTVTLNEGDVIQVTNLAGGGTPDVSDPTGTRVTANKPVQVIAGHTCTDVPYNVYACDHLEEAMLPIETLGSSYVVSAPLIAPATDKGRMVRVIAIEPSTTITYDPAQAGAPTTLTNAGDYFELQTTAAFEITANRRVLVAEYMLGQDAGGASGDPAMVLGVPVQQFRTNYLFHAPVNYVTNYVNITAPEGATVTLDDMTLAAGTPVGTSGYSVMKVQLDNTGTGNHVVEATDRVGITVYGYGNYTSYWYPGGLELTQF